jgi:hypothetical protein
MFTDNQSPLPEKKGCQTCWEVGFILHCFFYLFTSRTEIQGAIEGGRRGGRRTKEFLA